MSKVLIVIPARAHSKTIPNKTRRFLQNKPLICYSIEAAKNVPGADVLVSTNDPFIKKVSELTGVNVLERPEELCEDNVPLCPVVYHAVESWEKISGKEFEYVVTLQPTSPLVCAQSIQRAIQLLEGKNCDTVISVKEIRRLFWTKTQNGYRPFYSERKNRQWLEPVFGESGAIIACRRQILRGGSRFGEKVELLQLSEEEAIDVDTWQDLLLAESALKRIKVAFRVDGEYDIGLGHIYRALTLAETMPEHEITFFLKKDKELGILKVKENDFPVTKIADNADFINNYVRDYDIVINDILDTDITYMRGLKENGVFVVNFEDLGEGARLADLLFNALYEWTDHGENTYYGYKYECLRDEFFLFPVKDSAPEEVRSILVSFGGTDPNNLTLRLLNIMESEERLKNYSVSVLTGLGYKQFSPLEEKIKMMNSRGFKIHYFKNVPLVAELMYKADLVITSNGRTVFEATSLALPLITISQNERELLHSFSRFSSGVLNLGLHSQVSDESIKSALLRLIDDADYRRYLHSNLLKYAPLIRNGKNLVKQIIFEKYYEKRDKERKCAIQSKCDEGNKKRLL